MARHNQTMLFAGFFATLREIYDGMADCVDATFRAFGDCAGPQIFEIVEKTVAEIKRTDLPKA